MWIDDPATQPWAGTEASLKQATELASQINATSAATVAARASEDDDFEIPSLLSKQGNIGVISISGTLYASAPDWAKAFFGVTDYPMIRQALVDAARDPDIRGILLDINSPGGAVSGVSDVSALVSRINNGIKPVVSYTSGMMASAAYWIGAAASQVYAGSASEVGSVGVIARHMEHSKALEKEGVTVTTVRSGPYKQAVNPYEPLTALAHQDLQSKVDYMYGLFLADVASARNVPLSIADSKFGQGRVFLGQQAVDSGLIDGLATYEEALDKVLKMSAQSVDKRKSLNHNAKKQQEGTKMPQAKAALTEQEIAALASGALPGAATQPAAPEAPEASEQSSTTVEPPQETQPQTAAPAPAAPGADAAVVTLLQAQLSAANEQLLNARLSEARLTEQVAALQVANEALTPIARDAVSKMCVALGRAGTHAANLSGAELVAEHAKVSADFRAAFPIGGVAATGTSDEKPSTEQAVATAEQRARVAATRFVK